MFNIGMIALALTVTLPPNANDVRDAIGAVRYEQAVQNLLIGLASDNDGLRRSSAYILGEIKSDEAVIPLMRALKSGSDERTQITAALSLCKIGDARGVFAVKQEGRFNGSNKVRNSCVWFYHQYVGGGLLEMPTTAGAAQLFTID